MENYQILIVEDEDVTRFSLRNLFEAEGYDVYEAIDGDTMTSILAKQDINLVIMDINLPGKNGLLLGRELASNKNLGLIFLTGRDSDIDKILGLEIGADDYLTKPFNPRELTIRARNILSRIGQNPSETEEEGSTVDNENSSEEAPLLNDDSTDDEVEVTNSPEMCNDGIISPFAAEKMLGLTELTDRETIYSIYDRIEGVAELFENCSDPWGMFPTTYKYITARGIRGIEEGNFEDPDWAEDIILDFAGRYLENLQLALLDDEPSWAWARYYELADRSDVSKTRALLMAMSAHLLLDLPHSLAYIDSTEENKDDFFMFGDLMIEVTDDFVRDLNAIYGTDAEDVLNGFFFGQWVDGAFGEDTSITLK